jgi:hypothetical protein
MIENATLKSSNLFIQANTVGGHSFMEKALDIMKLFDPLPPVSTVNNELSFTDPIEGVNSIRITSEFIHAYINALHPNIPYIINYFSDKIVQISQVMGIENYSRLGERRHYIHEFSTEQEKMNYFKKFVKFDDFEEVAFNRLIKTGLFKAEIKVSPSRNTNNRGILIDIDIYYNAVLNIANLKDFITDINNTFDKVLGLVC